MQEKDSERLVKELVDGLGDEDTKVFAALEASSWVIEVEDEDTEGKSVEEVSFAWRKNDDATGQTEFHGPHDREEMIHAARVLHAAETRKSRTPADSGLTSVGEIAKKVVETTAGDDDDPSTAADRHARIDHEVALRDRVISFLKGSQEELRTNVECSSGTADIVTEDAVYEISCGPTAALMPDLIRKVLGFCDDLGMIDKDALIVTCCCEELETLKALAWDDKVHVVTFEELTTPPPKLPAASAAARPEILKQQMHPSRMTRHPSLIMRDGGLDETYVQELVEFLEAGGEFKDEVDVFYDDTEGKHWVADGNHRHEASLRVDKLLDINLHWGSLRDAMEFALGANADHGRKQTDDDKRLKVVGMLSDREWFKQSDSQLARLARGAVTQQFVSKVRRALKELVPALQADANFERGNATIAATLEIPEGLVRIVRDLPADEQGQLFQNVLGDTGERVGADGVSRSAKTTVEPGPSLFPDKESEEEASAEEHTDDETVVDEAAPVPEEAPTSEQLSPSFRLAELLKGHPEGLETDEVLTAGFTMFDINQARTSRVIERHENGKCFYAWKADDIVEVLRERGTLTRLELEELGCQFHAIASAESDRLIRRTPEGDYTLPEEGEEEEEAAELTEAAASEPDASFSARMINAGWELKREGKRFYANNASLRMGTILFDKAQDAIEDAEKQQKQHEEREAQKREQASQRAAAAPSKSALPTGYTTTPPSQQHPARAEVKPYGPSIETRLKGRTMVVGITFIKGLKGKVQGTVNVDGDVKNAGRELFPVEELALPPAILRMIDQRIGGTTKVADSAAASAAAASEKKDGKTTPKADRIVAALKGAKSAAELETLVRHFKLPAALTGYSAGDANLIKAALTSQKKKVSASGKSAKASSKKPPAARAAKKSSAKKAAKKGAAKPRTRA